MVEPTEGGSDDELFDDLETYWSLVRKQPDEPSALLAALQGSAHGLT